MTTKKNPSLAVGRGEKLPVSKGAGLTAKGRAKKIPISNKLDKLIDLDVNRASLYACGILALNTSKSFFLCKFRCIAEIHFLEIFIPYIRALSRHFLTWNGKALFGRNMLWAHNFF